MMIKLSLEAPPIFSRVPMRLEEEEEEEKFGRSLVNNVICHVCYLYTPHTHTYTHTHTSARTHTHTNTHTATLAAPGHTGVDALD